MRCLYCGNELPVFRKLTGGGEFCSEAHRVSYQEEYNRLALNRLLQAQTSEDRAKSAKRPDADLSPVAAGYTEKPVTAGNGTGSSHLEAVANGKHAPVRTSKAVATSALKEDEAVAPADALDFLWEVPDPIWWESPDIRAVETEFIAPAPKPVPPAAVGLLEESEIEDQDVDLSIAQPMSLAALREASAPRDYKTRTRESRLEVREFGRVEPRVTIALGTSSTAKLISAAAARDFEIAATPPSDAGSQPPWFLDERPFPNEMPELEFRASLRLAFPTTGIEVPSEDGGEPQIVQVTAPEVLSRLDAANKTTGLATETDLRSLLMDAACLTAPAVDDLLLVHGQDAAEALETPSEPTPLAGPAEVAAVPVNDVVRAVLVDLDETATAVVVVDPTMFGTQAEEAVVEEIAVESDAPVAAAVDVTATEEATASNAEEVPVVAEVSAAPRTEIEAAAEHVREDDTHAAEPTVQAAEIESQIAPAPEPAVAPEAAAPSAPPEPRRALTPLPVPPRALQPAAAVAQPAASWVPVTSFRMHLPRVAGLPMRPVMTFGPAPHLETPADSAQTVDDTPKSEVAANISAPAAELSNSERRPRDGRNASRNFRIRNRSSQPSARIEPQAGPEKPTDPPQAVVPQPAAIADSGSESAKEPKPAVSENKAPVRPEAPRPAANPQKPVPAPAPVPDAKTKPEKVARDTKPFEKPAPAANYLSFNQTSPHLELQPAGVLERLPVIVKIGAAVAILAVLGTVAFLSLGSGSKGGKKELVVESAGPGMLIGEAGWSTDWTGEAAGVKRLRQISIYRPSLNLADYRVELQGQIEAKSMGVVYRANNPQNYYVLKLEILKPGLNPQVALVRWAVINGEDGPRAQIPLPMPVRIDTLYKLRLDVRGDTFATYVLDQKVDQWTDNRIRSGGVGLINERGDRSTIKAVMVTPLAARSK